MPDTWPQAPAGAAPAAPPRRAPQRTVRELAPAPDAALRVAPLPLAGLVASAVALSLVQVAVGFSMGRATRTDPIAVTCRCAP